jgi:hypothetical protein
VTSRLFHSILPIFENCPRFSQFRSLHFPLSPRSESDSGSNSLAQRQDFLRSLHNDELDGEILPFLISLHFTWLLPGRKIGGCCQKSAALVGDAFRLLSVILKAFSVAPFDLLYPEEMFNISALQVMTKCSLFQNSSTF